MYEQSGFNFLELLLSVLIITIIASFILPTYWQYEARLNRLTATNSLLQLALAMEQYHTRNGSYSGVSLQALNFPIMIADGSYQARVMSSPHFYQLFASPEKFQSHYDDDCGTLMLDSNGEKFISGKAAVSDCWL